MKARRPSDPLACGHFAAEVGCGRCWPCHLAHLRSKGEGARADRLERLRQLQEESRLDWRRLVLGLVAGFEQTLEARARAGEAMSADASSPGHGA